MESYRIDQAMVGHRYFVKFEVFKGVQRSTSTMSFNEDLIPENFLSHIPGGGGGLHDLRMDGGLPPGFQIGTHF